MSWSIGEGVFFSSELQMLGVPTWLFVAGSQKSRVSTAARNVIHHGHERLWRLYLFWTARLLYPLNGVRIWSLMLLVSRSCRQKSCVCVCVLLCKTMENATGLAHSDARNVLKEAFKGPAAKPLGVALVLFARLLNYNMSFAACCHSPHRLLILTHSPHVPCRVYVGVSAFPGA